MPTDHRHSRALCAAILGATAALPSALAQTAQLSDQTASAGLTAIHTTDPGGGLRSMSGGIAVGDFNRDGWQDVFVLGGPHAPDKLYINNHDGTFTDRATQWGVARTHWGFALAVGDFNNDGWPDVYITSAGTDSLHCHHLLYVNNGNGTFTDVAATAGVQSTTPLGFDGFGAAWGDYDLDGDLDLAVAGYQYGSGGNKLFRNNGNGTFTDATSSLGYNLQNIPSFSPRFIDMDGDRYPELLWVADFHSSKYFVNNRNGTFTEATAAAGVGLDANGMGMAIGDFDNDGRPDWFVTSIFTTLGPYQVVPGSGNMLYLNQGNHHFTQAASIAGVGQSGWGWGAVAADFRNIGRQDIAATNGWDDPGYGTQFLADPTCVFQNNGNGTFANVAPACGVTHSGQGRGMVEFDYNNDGRPDLLIASNGGPLTLYRNDTPPAPGGSNWLRIFLNTRASHGIAPDGYGAHVVVTAGPAVQHRWISGGSNYLSQSELSAHFGLGAAPVASQIRVEWPDGSVTLRANIPANRTITLSPCPGDWNAGGELNVQDIFDFLNDWFAGGGDFDASGTSSIQDIFDFLNAWFAGC
ncbi:MAG TPA: CRTAC1 family protein [Phycisphaerales bacterium]|nr:CRTAC1 family protein [Phycisphaerales bacterium]